MLCGGQYRHNWNSKSGWLILRFIIGWVDWNVSITGYSRVGVWNSDCEVWSFVVNDRVVISISCCSFSTHSVNKILNACPATISVMDHELCLNLSEPTTTSVMNQPSGEILQNWVSEILENHKNFLAWFYDPLKRSCMVCLYHHCIDLGTSSFTFPCLYFIFLHASN